tara:strand:+ start:264 stop:380 length:117 start_codon:yes stop_codon:yes gene_type:complete
MELFEELNEDLYIKKTAGLAKLLEKEGFKFQSPNNYQD